LVSVAETDAEHCVVDRSWLSLRISNNLGLYCVSLQVAVRMRPLNECEIIEGATPIAHRVDENVSAINSLSIVEDLQLMQFAKRLRRILWHCALLRLSAPCYLPVVQIDQWSSVCT